MGFFTDYSKNSFQICDRELAILKTLVSMAEDNLPFPQKASGVLDDVSICWAPEMIFTEDSTHGMWTYFHLNSIYIRPEENEPMAIRIAWNVENPSEKNKNIISSMKKKQCWSEIMLKELNEFNHEFLTYALYLLESEGHTITTVLHELWHRQQFISNPMKYFVSCIATNLVNYEWACKQPWSIEYDVRKRVDNDIIKHKLKEIYHKFYRYVYLLNQSKKRELYLCEQNEIDIYGNDKQVKTILELVKK